LPGLGQSLNALQELLDVACSVQNSDHHKRLDRRRV
jgi:hypothetical protein